MQHQASKGDEVQSCEDRRQPLVVTRQAAEARGPGEAALDDPALRRQHEAALGLGQLDDFQADAMPGGGIGRLLTGVALIHVGQLDRLASGFLHGSRQDIHLGAVLGIGRGDVQREQVAQRVDSGMDLGAFAPLVPVVAGPSATLGCRWQRPAVQDRRRGLAGAALGQAQQHAQIVDDGFEDAGIQPAARLLVDGLPAGEVVRQHPPLGPRAGQPAQGVEDLTQVVAPLRRVFTHQGKVGGDEGPFLVADISRIGLAR